MNQSRFAYKFVAVLGMLKSENERGSVIVAAAFIDDTLRQILQAKLLSNVGRTDDLMDGPNAPVGTMASRVDLAFRTGCISSKLCDSLHAIRKLRNDFAHLPRKLDFEDQSIQDRTRNLLEKYSSFIEEFWPLVEPELFLIDENKPPSGSRDSFQDLLKREGYKKTFEVWASSVVAVLDGYIEKTERVEPFKKGSA
jgi:hypothetical protein